MKIAIVNNMVPFLYGGAEFLVDSLAKQLELHGHRAEKILFPFSWKSYQEILDSIMAVQLSVLDNTDLVIALKFPAYYIAHPNKKLWLLHQFRQAYDLYGTEFSGFHDENPLDYAMRHGIINLDTKVLGELEGRIFTNSQVVSDRLMKFNGIDSEVLYPPLMDASLYKLSDEYGDFIFYPGRVNLSKRQHLAVEAMRYTKSGVKLVLAGKGDSEEDEKHILELIEQYSLWDKVTYLQGFISERKKVELYEKCLASLYIPYDEDSYGYVTLESFQAGKAVISCTDAGGTDVVVKDGVTGYMTASSPEDLAEAMDKMYYNRKKTREMGKQGLPLLEKLGITWENVIRRLTE